MKLRIAGAANFVNRMFEACGHFQWARELLKNSLEAGARRVELGVDWQAVEKLGVYRRCVADDGCGMDRRELLDFFSTLGEGGKKIGGIHENFGVGAKIATLPWNPDGVVVVSYKHGKGTMIWIVLDAATGDYELVEFEVDGTRSCAIAPGVVDGYDWTALKPDWIGEHGTVVVLLGSGEHPDTMLGNAAAGEKEAKGLAVYLNSRFWDLSAADVRVAELRSDKRSQWPRTEADADEKRLQRCAITGARHYLTEVEAPAGKLVAGGVLPLAGGHVAAEWYLWGGERPAIAPFAREKGYLAVRYGDELFQITSHKVHFRWFGVIESQVQQNLTIVLEPPLYHPRRGAWGVHPDQSRNRLLFTGDGDKGVEIPLADWGLEFAERMPAPILQAIRAARGAATGSIEDDAYRKRLQDRFGNRWTVSLPVVASDDRDAKPVSPSEGESEVFEPHTAGEERGRRRRAKPARAVAPKAKPGDEASGSERQVPVDVPRFRLAHAGEFEEPWHLALWAPHDPDGPTVLVNVDSPVLDEIIRHHQEQFADVYAEEVAAIIRLAFGEIAACKIAHSQKLTKSIPEEELDRDYRTERALTLSLMGLLAEETLIAQRLAKLGRRKLADEPASEGKKSAAG